jgi:RNA polymerase sigma-70 factor, ECF subfamily
MIRTLAALDSPDEGPTAEAEPWHHEAALLARAALGDDRAFAELYEIHRRRLYRLAFGVLLDVHEAREAVQEAFLQLHRAAPTWEPRALVGTWLYRVVLNHCLSLKQRLLRFARSAGPPELSSSHLSGASPEKSASLKEAAAIVQKSLSGLPARQRAVACLFLEAELAPTEIAPLVDMTPNAARVTLHRALTQIRADLAAAGIDAPPTADEAFFSTHRVSTHPLSTHPPSTHTDGEV